MRECKAPDLRLNAGYQPRLFLAGSIEQGAAQPWQARVVSALAPFDGVIYNPRRDDWNASWEQVPENAQFREQVTWELEGIAAADLVVFWFDPATKSPIALLELGLICGQQRPSLVYCPRAFYRYGNVALTTARVPSIFLTENADFWFGLLAAWAATCGCIFWHKATCCSTSKGHDAQRPTRRSVAMMAKQILHRGRIALTARKEKA